MENKKFVPFEKLSKKEQKKINLQKRNNWNGCNPTTKVVPSAKQYSRKTKHKKSALFEC
jgi:hypothetical protein